jgi:hypothetical protein
MAPRPSENVLFICNSVNRKRGWIEEVSGTLEREKKEQGMISRSEIKTLFQFIDADEGRSVNGNIQTAARGKNPSRTAFRVDSNDPMHRVAITR